MLGEKKKRGRKNSSTHRSRTLNGGDVRLSCYAPIPCGEKHHFAQREEEREKNPSEREKI